MTSRKLDLGEYHVIGIAVRTSNEKGKAESNIPALWGTFFKDEVREKFLTRSIILCTASILIMSLITPSLIRQFWVAGFSILVKFQTE